MKKYQSFLSKNFQSLEVKFSIYLNRHVFVMEFHIVAQHRIPGRVQTEPSGWVVTPSLSSYNMTGLILFGPAAFLALSFFRSFNIPGSEMLISGITGVGVLSFSGIAVWGMTLSSTRSCTLNKVPCRRQGLAL